MRPSRQFVERLRRFDPTLVAEFDPIAGLWGIFRLHGSPTRGRPCTVPRYHAVQVGGDNYRLKRGRQLVCHVSDRDGGYIDLDSVGHLIMRKLREGDTWNRERRVGKEVLSRGQREREAAEVENEQMKDEVATTVSGMRNLKVDYGAREDHNNPARTHMKKQRDKRLRL